MFGGWRRRRLLKLRDQSIGRLNDFDLNLLRSHKSDTVAAISPPPSSLHYSSSCFSCSLSPSSSCFSPPPALSLAPPPPRLFPLPLPHSSSACHSQSGPLFIPQPLTKIHLTSVASFTPHSPSVASSAVQVSLPSVFPSVLFLLPSIR